MNIGLIGRSELMYSTAQLIIKNGFNVVFIITSKEAPEYEVKSQDFEILANEIGASFLHTGRLGDDESFQFLQEQEACDIVLSVNYSGVIPDRVVDYFKFGILNAHAGDLPRYRGNACPAWAIINAESKVGLCIHNMIGGELDSGKIIAREYLPIDIDTTVGECYKWMNERIPFLFMQAVQHLSKDSNYCVEVQSIDPKDALRCYPRRPEDGQIDWSDTAENICRLINASGSPFSGAFAEYKGKKVTFHDVRLYEDSENYLAIPGQVSEIKNGEESVIVITGKGKIEILTVSTDNSLIKIPAARLVSGIRNRFTKHKL